MNKLTHLLLLGISFKLNLTKPLNPPYQFSIEPTNSCNFKCVFCPQSDTEHKRTRKQGYLTVENMQLFLKQIRSVNPGNKNISLTLDGEPTLNKALPEFIRLINAEGLFPRFSSNAKNLTPGLVDKLAASGYFLASIDFASEAKYFDNVRGRSGDFEIVLENLRYLVEAARKIPKIKLEIVNISHFSGADTEKTLRDMKSLFPDNLPSNIAFWSRTFHNFCGHMETNTKKSYHLCPYPWTMFTVTWNGDVVACCRDTRARTVLGNVFSQTISDIWHAKEYQNFRLKLIEKKVSDIAACKDCDLPWRHDTSRWKIRYVLSSLLRR
jgi:radical SAM protein with 4Fe4S-binding SPASM domain